MTELKPNEYGAVLRRRREELGLSLEDMAASTRIRKTYLQALEDENLQVLPGSTYVVGFLRIYAQQLSLPVGPLLAAINNAEEFDDSGEAVPAGSSRRQLLPRSKRSQGGGKRPYLLLLLLAGAVAVLLALWAGGLFERSLPARVPPPAPAPASPPAPQQVLPQPPPVSPQLSVSPPPVTMPETVQAEVKSTELAVIPPAGAVVRMLPTAVGAIKVSLDGQEFRTYELQPEQSLHWKVSDSLAVEFSSPGLLRIWVDQQELPIAEYPALVLKRVSLQEARP